MKDYFTSGFFKFLLGFSLLILVSFIAIALFGGKTTVAGGSALWYTPSVHDWRQQAS